MPFAVTVTKYDLRRQIIEIGAEPAKIKAETDYITAKRQAEAEAIATQVKADAEAYSIRVVREELAQAPAEALTYFQVQRWDGRLPVYMLGQTLPFLQLPTTPVE